MTIAIFFFAPKQKEYSFVINTYLTTDWIRIFQSAWLKQIHLKKYLYIYIHIINHTILCFSLCNYLMCPYCYKFKMYVHFHLLISHPLHLLLLLIMLSSESKRFALIILSSLVRKLSHGEILLAKLARKCHVL